MGGGSEKPLGQRIRYTKDSQSSLANAPPFFSKIETDTEAYANLWALFDSRYPFIMDQGKFLYVHRVLFSIRTLSHTEVGNGGENV